MEFRVLASIAPLCLNRQGSQGEPCSRLLQQKFFSTASLGCKAGIARRAMNFSLSCWAKRCHISCAIFKLLRLGAVGGVFGIELVKQTGCKYIGITLSEEQLKFAQNKVPDAALQDHGEFLLLDYSQLPDTSKCDRIIDCEVLAHIGHEYIDDFFDCCESVLTEDGIFVLQFIAISDER
ncbi:hypothetical protein FNV43_RR02510 [Rhamnella rubrinervis]|uniref:Uncharacterized protein n=1 Tax=Rhamnella rubrinervis TaxID=2594499 RepID=A0A8K0MU15_9ROSA|nr:hypothetical protein FNV43_RR02510 [Rhamnella rubrinervis]